MNSKSHRGKQQGRKVHHTLLPWGPDTARATNHPDTANPSSASPGNKVSKKNLQSQSPLPMHVHE